MGIFFLIASGKKNLTVLLHSPVINRADVLVIVHLNLIVEIGILYCVPCIFVTIVFGIGKTRDILVFPPGIFLSSVVTPVNDCI